MHSTAGCDTLLTDVIQVMQKSSPSKSLRSSVIPQSNVDTHVCHTYFYKPQGANAWRMDTVKTGPWGPDCNLMSRDNVVLPVYKEDVSAWFLRLKNLEF